MHGETLKFRNVN